MIELRSRLTILLLVCRRRWGRRLYDAAIVSLESMQTPV